MQVIQIVGVKWGMHITISHINGILIILASLINRRVFNCTYSNEKVTYISGYYCSFMCHYIQIQCL